MGEHNFDVVGGAEQFLDVSAVLPHPNYDPNTEDNDIALLQLVIPATLTENVQIIKLLNDQGIH